MPQPGRYTKEDIMEHVGRTVGLLAFIVAINLAMAYITPDAWLGNVTLATLVAFVAGYLVRDTEAE